MGCIFNQSYPLGKMMKEDNVGVNDLAARTKISHRRLSDYLANRIPFLPHHLITLADFFECDPEDLVPDERPLKANPKAGAYG